MITPLGVTVPQLEANNLTFEYETFGDAEAPPVLFIMGLGAQMITWPAELCQAVADEGYRVVRFDNRDIGLSSYLDHLGDPDMMEIFGAAVAGESVDAPYVLADMALDSIGVLDALGYETAHIVGASMGGMIAQRLVINHPERARSLTSIFSMPRFILGDDEVSAALMGEAPETREERIVAGIEAARLFSGGGFPFDEDEVRLRVAEGIDRAWHPEGQVRQTAAIVADGDRTEGLQQVDLPTVVIHGTGDRLVIPQGGQETADAVPGAELVWIDGMGHELPEAAWPTMINAMATLFARAEA
ncbi:MAG: alpha/beta hydrolase [Acidimicrobiales bacterium]